MGEIIDNRGQADHATDGIVSIINAMAKSKQAETELQKTLMLDQITRQRNRQDKQQEQQDQNSAWASAIVKDNPQGNPMTNDSGVANGATPSQVAAPTDAITMPQGQPSLPPMTMADPSQQPARDAMSMAQPPQSVVQPQVQTQVQPSATPMAVQATAPEHPASQIADLGFTPIGVGQLGLTRKGKPEAKDFAYIGALNKAKQGTATDGELQLIKDFNGYKGDKDSNAFAKLGIDTVNLTPDQIGVELQQKNPGHYAFLNSIKNGEYKVTGRSSKEMNKVVEEVQTIWPGTDLQALQARYDTRKDFTSGKTSQNITALNTALSHLDKLSKNADTLDNGNFRFGNKLGNILKTQTGDSRVRTLNADIHAVTGELASTFKQSGATDTEIKNFQDALDAADSKDTVGNVVNEFIGLIGGRTQPLLEKWQTAFGQDATFPVVGRNGAKVLEKHGFNWDPMTGEISEGTYYNSGTGPMNDSGPAVGTVEGGYKFKGGDPSKPESWEKN